MESEASVGGPGFVMPNTSRELPVRMKDLDGMEDPRWIRSGTDRIRSGQTMPYARTAGPYQTGARSSTGGSGWTRSKTDRLKPS